ncbi:MAG TPA: hypothetical protein VET89_03225 [Stellaceae bacterium]|nr:hypothetical protein [Stellaceae bacterium]
MNKYTCTMMSISDIYYATLIAENEEQAKAMAIAETKKRGYGGGQPRNWSVRVLEADVDGPASVLDCGYREA